MSSETIGKSIIVSAPSGAGKTTLVKHLLAHRQDLCFSISATNRPIRGNEIEGRDYYFLSDHAFNTMVINGDFLEWEEVYKGRFYGTLNSEVERIWKENKHVIFDVDVIGGLHLKEKLNEKAIAIFISPGDIETLEKRLKNRETEEDAEILMRLNKAEDEMKTAAHFDCIIINDDLSKAQDEILKVISNFLDHG